MAILSLVPLAAAGLLEARGIAWLAVALAFTCLLAGMGWRRRWGWRRPALRPAERARAWAGLGAGIALLLVAARLVPPTTGVLASLYALFSGMFLFGYLLVARWAAWTDAEFRRACRRLLREAPRAAAHLPRWMRNTRRAFYAYMAVTWVAGLAYFYAFGMAVQGGAPAAEGARTERLQTNGRVAYVTPRVARTVGWLGAATTLNLPLVVMLGIILQVGLKVPILGPGRARRP